MNDARHGLLPEISVWLNAEPEVQSAVLFGSSARAPEEPAGLDSWSDFDLQIVTSDAARFERVDWTRALPSQQFALQVVRQATGGVRKVTALFAAGQIDLVIVPAVRMKFARLAIACGLHRRGRFPREALNEIATCLYSGYRFLKGQKEWRVFYERVASEMPGVRLNDGEAGALADIFLCDLLWILQKIERGECAAAQHVLHRSLAETNFRLMREFRQRRGFPLPSFGLGRRVESLLEPDELALVQVNARLEHDDLHKAAWRAFDGLKKLMLQLVPAWQVPVAMHQLLAAYGERLG